MFQQQLHPTLRPFYQLEAKVTANRTQSYLAGEHSPGSNYASKHVDKFEKAFHMNEYRVYKVRHTLAVQDPDMVAQGPRFHTILFVETEADGSGVTHHVTGDLVTGMAYQWRREDRPEDIDTFHSKALIGLVEASRYPEPFNTICQSQPAPTRQKAFNPITMKTEPIKVDGTFYLPGEARPSLVKCTEWIEQQVIPALRDTRTITFLDSA